MSSQSSALGQQPLRTVQVLGGGSAGSSAHVRSLAAGLAARGVRVAVCAPSAVDRLQDFGAAGAHHIPVARSSDPAALASLRGACADADLVHAHGLHAGMRAALALGGLRTPLVVTWHTRAYAEGARAPLLRLLEKRVARAASVVLAPSSDLVLRARRRGARDARYAPTAFPAPPAGPRLAPADAEARRNKTRAELGAVDRPLLVAAGSLERHRGYGTLLDAARQWARAETPPLLVIAGEGPERSGLQARVWAEELPVRLLGRREDAAELIAAADLAVLPSRWEARSVLAQQALVAGVPLVASRVGGIPELVGDGAALVPYGDPGALAATVLRLLDDAPGRRELARRGRRQAASWPTEDATVAQVLSVYDELTSPRAGL
ncbi:glycosyltransferase family 4 protein [Streptomyces albidoflavus]|uniref:glycosyltransferase family 4 protein n=1 Tax=Streptomyces albidoflavus TaxID=1886 RepID=UPI001F5D810A|nr:glycosyltransferase family 4 protein [Streptomyces albidoflavus]